MKLSDKAAKINFDDLDDDASVAASPGTAAAPASPAPVAPRARTTGVAGITERINLHHQVQELQAQVSTLERAQVVLKLDPRWIRDSKWKNRHELSFATAEFAVLKSEIEAAGGNVQPIKVRRVGKGADGQHEYEIVYGRRRRRACLELGFDVAAIVEDMDDIALFKEMERENRSRADLSPWEQGVMYKDALDGKLFASQRQMAAELGVSLGALNVALALASLPEEVVSAFPSPLDLQYRWAAVLNEALERDTARVLTVARELGALEVKPSAKEVLAKLCGAAIKQAEGKRQEILVGKRPIGWTETDSKGAMTIKLRPGVLTSATQKKLLDYLEQLLS